MNGGRVDNNNIQRQLGHTGQLEIELLPARQVREGEAAERRP
jgi:hypothetical protein